MNNTDTVNTAPLVFNCSCNGCRGYSPRIAEIYDISQLSSKVEGHYFSPATMRFFSSRLGNWRRLDNPAAPAGINKLDGVAVIVSSRYGYEGAEREYELITVCGYGSITRQDSAGVLDKYPTSRAANKALDAATYPGECSCHGCQLDRSNGLGVRSAKAI
jgi:hypothetical protein